MKQYTFQDIFYFITFIIYVRKLRLIFSELSTRNKPIKFFFKYLLDRLKFDIQEMHIGKTN